jgi:hypothetical protein
MMTDMYLRDFGGQVVLVARLQSLLHRNYTVVDGTGAVSGQIVEKTHLTHSTYGFEDLGSNTIGAVGVSNVERRRGIPPSCWIEDASGNRLANIVYVGSMSFGAYRADESSIFDVYPSGGGGVMSGLVRVLSGPYAVRVNDASFPLPLVLTTVTAIVTVLNTF